MRWHWSLVIVCAAGASSLSLTFAQDSSECLPGSAFQVLQAWELASADLMGVGPLEHRRLYYLHREQHSAHALALLNEFRGAVSAAELKQRFHWSLKLDGEQPLLVGEPKDALEKLFYTRFEVTMDAATQLPTAVRFAGPAKKQVSEPLAVVLSPRLEEPNLFSPAPDAKPLQYASRDEQPQTKSPVRMVEHLSLKPIPKEDSAPNAAGTPASWQAAADCVQVWKATITAFWECREFHRNAANPAGPGLLPIKHKALPLEPAPTELHGQP